MEALHDEVKSLREWRTKMLVSLLGVIAVGALAAGGTFFQVEATQEKVDAQGEQLEAAKSKQNDIARKVDVIENEVSHIKEEQQNQRRLLERIDENTRPR